MQLQTFNDIFSEEFAKDAILNEEYTGFKEDYLMLHCLLKIRKPKRLMEIGTNMGTGTRIIKNALGGDSEVLSLDLPTDLAHISLQHPINEGKGDAVGHRCTLPFTQLRGDSLKYDYSQHYPINGWYIDGEHDFKHAYHESCEAFKSGADIIIWHDTDIEPVMRGIQLAYSHTLIYDLFRITDTRISYAIRKYDRSE